MIDKELELIEREIEKRQTRLDQVNELSKKAIRIAGSIMAMIHNNEDVEEKIGELRKYAETLKKVDSEFRWHALQALQEYVEAEALYSIKRKGVLPDSPSLNVSPEAYLLGIMDVIGELRREVIDSLNDENLERAESLYKMIREIFDVTRGMRYTESLVPGFRRKQDVARIQMENSGSEILLFKGKKRL